MAIVLMAFGLSSVAEGVGTAEPGSLETMPAAPFDAIAQLRAGAATTTRPVEMGLAPAFGSDRFVIRSEAPNRIEFSVTVPPRGVLRIGFSVLPSLFKLLSRGGRETTAGGPGATAEKRADAAAPPGGAAALPSEDTLLSRVSPVRCTVEFEPAGGAARTLVERVVDIGRPGDRRWFDYRIDLSGQAGAQGVLRLTHDVVAPSGARGRFADAYAEVGWTRPVLFDPVAEAERPNLLLITIDALRADHLGSYGYARPTTPRLDALARDGVRYARAYTNAPMTVPSLPQMLASRYFPDRGQPTLATQLFAGGVPVTKAIVNNIFLNLWLTFRSRETFDVVTAAPLQAEQITRAAIRWLDARGGDRFALYLHYLDTHTPYHVPAPWAGRFVDPAYRGPIDVVFRDADSARAARFDAADRQRIVDLYDGTIAYVDAAIGALIDALETRGLLANTLVVITADHGEELWDHGAFFHGQSLYDELLHVPLIVRLPGAAAAGTVVDATVRAVDIVPTIVDGLGLPSLLESAGKSLLAARGRPATGPDREVFARAANPVFPHRFALRRGIHKYIVTVETGAEELYDLDADPGERVNLLGERTAAPVLAELRDRLAVYRAPLATTGFQLRAVATDGRAHVIEAEIAAGGGIPLTDVDRIGLDVASQLTYGNGGRLLRWTGPVAADPVGIRFAHDLLRAGGVDDRLTFTVNIDGRIVPPAAIRLGGGSAAPASPFDYTEGRPDLVATRSPGFDGGPDGGVAVSIWRTPDEEVSVLPREGVLTPERREQLRALGYAE